MPRNLKPNTRETKILMSELVLHCEWGECNCVYENMDDLLSHMSKHLVEQHTTADDPMDKDEEFLCQWRECNTLVQGQRNDFLRHAYFHCFHVKIKNIGDQMIRKMELRGCMLENQSRNLIPELPERLQCGWNLCETIIDNPEYFYRHVDNHAEGFPEGNNLEGGAKCEWEGCETVAKNKYKLREHLRSHTQEKVIACPTCGGLFSSRTKFVDHVKRQAGVEGWPYTDNLVGFEKKDIEIVCHALFPDENSQCYQCSHCNKRFSSERLLRDHVRHHVNQYKCPCCEMTCPTPSSLKSHLRYRHTNDKPYKCDTCDYGAKTLSDLRKHSEKHGNDSQFTCHFSSCSYVAKSFASLTNHFKRSHQEMTTQNYACHVCNAVFTRGSKLTVHLKKKHKFKWPSGHSRFRYKMHDDGFWRLQTVRYESMQLTQNQDSESSEFKDGNENQDKYVVVHDQSSEMICGDEEKSEIKKQDNTVVGIANPNDPTGYIISAKDLQGQQICDFSNLVSMETDQSGNTQYATIMADVDGEPREISVTIVEAPEGYQVMPGTKRKKEKHMTYNLEMLSDVAITLPGDVEGKEG